MIASENFVSEAVLEAPAPSSQQVCRGYPGRRYYAAASLPTWWRIWRATGQTDLRRRTRNVQPHSGSQANASAYAAVLQVGDTILALTFPWRPPDHGHKLSFSGKLYRPTFYHVRRDTELIDYDELEAIAEREKPKAIIGGASAIQDSGISSGCGRSPTRWAGVHLRYGAHRRPGGGGVHPRPCPTRTSPRPPRTRRCAAARWPDPLQQDAG